MTAAEPIETSDQGHRLPSPDVFDVEEERHRRFLVTRPAGYVLGACIVAPLTWFWNEPRMLWLALGMLAVAATSAIARTTAGPGRLTALLLLDTVWTGVVIAALGVHPLAAALLFAGHASTAYLTLPVRNARLIAAWVVVVLGALVLIRPDGPPSMTAGRTLVTEGIMALFGLGSIIGDFELIGKGIRTVATRRRRQLDDANHVAEQRAAALRTVSHELRTPLTSIGGFAHFLTSDDLSHEERVEFARRIANESAHLNHLVDDLLAGVRLDAGQLQLRVERVRAIDAAKQVADVFRPRGMVIDIDLDSTHAVVADAARLGQILRNLLSNVEKYGGPSARLSSRRHASTVVLSVSDSGPGVPPDVREAIFQDFTQSGVASEVTGTGLGLGISRRLARAMGGDLRCVDAPSGACFELELPVHD